mgnify:CR=1 FL=1
MSISPTDLDLTFDWVHFASSHGNAAWINRKTGATFLYSEYGDNEDPEPDDLQSDDWIAIPDKNQLDLGTRLVFRFAESLTDSQQEHIAAIFRSRGAYRRFKDYLREIDQIDNWHQYENRAEQEARLAWALANQIPIEKSDV